jgi:hypothetical protein
MSGASSGVMRSTAESFAAAFLVGCDGKTIWNRLAIA